MANTMFTNKRGQGLSLSTIVIAAIALLILVILSVLILRSVVKVNEGTGCEGIVGAYCTVNGEDQCDPNFERKRSDDGSCQAKYDDDSMCCIPI